MNDLRGFCIRFRRIASWNFRAPRIFSYGVCCGRRGGTSGESSGRGDSPADETSTSLLATSAEELRGVKKSENLLRFRGVDGVVEKKSDPPLGFVTGEKFPNCFAAVLNGLGGLSVPVIGPAECQLGQRLERYVSLWESRRGS